MSCLFFAVYMSAHYALPTSYGLAACYQADALEWVEPEEVVMTAIAEHANRGEFPVDSVSRAGAVGLMQIMPGVVREYEERTGVEVEDGDLFDPFVSIEIATHEIDRIKMVHATKPRCRGKDHHWSAHFLCSFRSREDCNTWYRQALLSEVNEWRDEMNTGHGLVSAFAKWVVLHNVLRWGSDVLR